jgi:membrane-bound lytic murein transglycosylase D
LQHNYSVLQSWPLAITAYNHGLSGVRRAVRQTGTKDLDQIIRDYESPSFGFASRNFYAAFLAALDVSGNPEFYFGPSRQEIPAPITLTAPAYLPADVLAIALGVDKKALRDLNPSLHHGVWNGTYFVPSGHALNLPGNLERSRTDGLLQQLAENFGFSAQRPQPVYEVRLGDSLSEVAEIHETTTRTLLALNKLRSAHQIHAGQMLRVPMGAAPRPLGAGAAAMLAAQRAGRGEGVAVDLARLVTVTMGGELRGHEDFAQSGEAHGTHIGECSEAARQSAEQGVSASAGAEDVWTALPAQPQPDLAADPADYGVSADGTVEIQIGETLGHYAEWLGLRSDRLRKLNGLRAKQSLIVGRRLKMEFSGVTPQRFEQLRVAHHQSRQLAYFERHRINGVVEHPIAPGDSLWLLAVQQYRIPLWLLRQYNPDIDTATVLPIRAVIYVPVVVELPERQPCLRAQVEAGSEDA